MPSLQVQHSALGTATIPIALVEKPEDVILRLDVSAQLAFTHAVIAAYGEVNVLGGFAVTAIQQCVGSRDVCGLIFAALADLDERLQCLTAVLASELAKLLFDFRFHRRKPHRGLASPLAPRAFMLSAPSHDV